MPGESREYFFRRVEIYDAEQQRRLVFLSNHLQFAPTTVDGSGKMVKLKPEIFHSP